MIERDDNMNKKKTVMIVLIIILVILALGVVGYYLYNKKGNNTSTNNLNGINVNLSNLTYDDGELKKYTKDDFNTFLDDYNNGNLPSIYVTEFLFDGVGMYKTYDLDDFIEEGNDIEVEVLDITCININTSGNVILTGDITGGMIAMDTNSNNKDTNIILNNVKIDTDSKKVPGIYVYNKDITYTGSKVTIKTVNGTKNYIEGGKLKKVSLIGSDELDTYSNSYTGDNKTNYSTYTNYYGVYTKSEIDNILFAKVKADNEDLQDADPYYYYKGSGAISSDIDLYFEGEGYLEVTSKNKEGIETKGNLEFIGGTGDYVVNSMDDALNTTTSDSENDGARNDLTINVKSMTAIVSTDADEGDAIDSNGKLTINGGNILAVAQTGQDAGIDSEKGIYVNGGTVIATGDMYDQVSSESEENYMVLSFGNKVNADTLITLLDSNDNVVMAYKTDRQFTNLVYSSSNLTDGTYYLYRDGEITGEVVNGVYTNITNYTKGTQLGYSSSGMQGGMGGPNGNSDGGTPPDDNSDRGTPPDNNGNTPPEKPDGDIGMMGGNGMMQNVGNASNKEFIISGVSNLFSGVGDLTE